jgi:hypothetical protein
MRITLLSCGIPCIGAWHLRKRASLYNGCLPCTGILPLRTDLCRQTTLYELLTRNDIFSFIEDYFHSSRARRFASGIEEGRRLNTRRKKMESEE